MRLFCILLSRQGTTQTTPAARRSGSSEAEEWTISGYTEDDRSYSGAALVSLSSGIMDFCYESSPSTSGPYRNQEEEKPMMKIHAKMAEAKKKKDTSG